MIFYFSGTGNSLQIAKSLADGKPLKNIAKTEPSTFEADEIGFVFPIYCGVVPYFVEDFIKASRFKANYIWFVATCGGSDGKCFPHMKKLLLDQGARLNYANYIVLPDNCIVFKTSIQDKEKQLKGISEFCSKVKTDIEAHKTTEIPDKFNKTASKFMWWGLRKLYKINKKKVNDDCINCGKCIELCPTKNIKFENKKIVFANNCASCFACIQWCPTHAIKFGRLEVNDDTVYTNPNISIDEMVEKNK